MYSESEYFTVQLVQHVNYTAFIDASSQEEAEQLAADYTIDYDWVQMEGCQPTEICTADGDYLEGDCVCLI